MGKKKGKALQGRAKQKQKSQKSDHAGSWSSKSPKHNRRNLDYDDEDDEIFQTFRGFSQSKPTSAFSTMNVSLRHQSIAFVSAGVNPPSFDHPPQASEKSITDQEAHQEVETAVSSEQNDENPEEETDDSTNETNIIVDAELQLPEARLAKMSIDSPQQRTEPQSEEQHLKNASTNSNGIAKNSQALPFVVDTDGDPDLITKFNPTPDHASRRGQSPASSHSSEEVVLFHGRNKLTSKPAVINDHVQLTSLQHSAGDTTVHSAHITDDLLRALDIGKQEHVPTPTPPSRQKYVSGDHPTPDEWTPAPSQPYWRKQKTQLHQDVHRPAAGKISAELPAKQSKGKMASAKGERSGQDAEEMISALQAEWKDVLRGKRLSKDTGAKVKPSKRRGKRGRKKSNREYVSAGLSDDDESDGEAAYDDYMANLAAQMDEEDGENGKALAAKDTTHSLSISGPSFVVDGQEFGHDELLPKHLEHADTVGDDDDDEWESESQLNPDSSELSSNQSRNTSDLEDELEYTERQQWEDEADLRQRRIDSMGDEHLARLFAKQQELGFDGDELVIDDGADMDSDGIGDVAAARAGLDRLIDLPVRTRGKRATKVRGRKKDTTNFPDASAFAEALDQYGEGGFDIMDYERPSLRPRKKGRKGQLPPEIDTLSDEDLKQDLHDAWENDRSKKQQKRFEREELRAQGLLGAGGLRGKADLGAKYRQGMTMKQVHVELKEFLLNDELHERAFPPMAKEDRKALHEIAVALQLTSKSRGAGKHRFPILYKTSRTVEYSDDLFERIIQASTRGFLTNRGKAKKFTKNMVRESTHRTGRGGYDKAGVTLRNGELVGANAAELGRENFGHRLMEKMGWTKGQALGKDGAGLLVPVEQRMRVGTAGLG